MLYVLTTFGLLSSAASPHWRGSDAPWNSQNEAPWNLQNEAPWNLQNEAPWNSQNEAPWNRRENSGWQRNNRRPHENSADYDVGISKELSRLLRHKLHTFRVCLKDGSVPVNDVLARVQRHHPDATLQKIQDAERKNEKSRFEIREIEGQLFIRAHQGHSKGSEVDANTAMAEVSSGEILGGFVYHGTHPHNRWSIEAQGLTRAGRQHIHFVEPEHKDLARNARMYVRLDVEQYLQDGGELKRSGNNVILAPGLSNSGTIPSKYLSFCDANLRELAQNQGQPSSSSQSQPWSGRRRHRRW